MHFAYSKPAKRIVSLTPLIDVVFILLIFFMLVSRYSEWSHIDVSAPAPSKQQNSNLAGTLLIRVSETGQLDIAGKPTNLDEIIKTINLARSNNPDQLLLIKPAEKLPIQELISILDEIRSTGVSNFSIIR